MGGPAHLSPLHRWVLAVTSSRGARFVIALTTLVSVAISVSMTLTFQQLFPTESRFGGLALAVLIPAVLTPLGTWLIVGPIEALAKAYRDLEVVASTDTLTGVPNRPRVFTPAEALLAALPAASALLVGMVDLDFFKTLNDTEGHAVGDEALVAIARALTGAVGADGVVGRIGGDEFALVVPVPPAGKPRSREFMAGIEAACSRVAVRPGVLIDASVGLRLVTDVDDIDEAIRLADEALYEAKANRPARAQTPVPRSA